MSIEEVQVGIFRAFRSRVILPEGLQHVPSLIKKNTSLPKHPTSSACHNAQQVVPASTPGPHPSAPAEECNFKSHKKCPCPTSQPHPPPIMPSPVVLCSHRNPCVWSAPGNPAPRRPGGWRGDAGPCLLCGQRHWEHHILLAQREHEGESGAEKPALPESRAGDPCYRGEPCRALLLHSWQRLRPHPERGSERHCEK